MLTVGFTTPQKCSDLKKSCNYPDDDIKHGEKKNNVLIVYYFGSHGSSWTLAVTELKDNLHYHN